MYTFLIMRGRCILLPLRVYFAVDVAALLDRHYGAWERSVVE